uniref:WAP domain-containing protein n=1 Tax=Cyprinus carpio TaxID=7962 RepID=A0A8C1S4I8_CYPCA
ISAKPGVCPIFSLDGAVLKPCLKLCFLDRNCPDDEKCCSNGCGRQCMPPYKGVCEELCSQDGDCLNDEKCCSNGCGHQCMAPSKGVCPRKALGIGLCHVLECVDDIDCPNDEKCCSTKCGLSEVCMEPLRDLVVEK